MGDDVRDQPLGLPACRAVADGDHGDVVHQHHFDHLLAAAADDVVFADHVDHGVAEHVAELVHGGQLAAAAEPRINGQHAAIANRRLQQQLAEIAREHLNRVQLGPFRQLAPHLTLQTRHQQTAQGVPQAIAQEFGVRMIRADQTVLGPLVQGPHVGFDLDAQNLGTFAAIDGQQPDAAGSWPAAPGSGNNP